MPKPAYLQFDTLDDRRQIAATLARLPPAWRVAFVDRCCRQSAVPNSGWRPGVARSTRELAGHARRDDSADAKLTQDLFFDVWNLAAQYDLDLDAALLELQRLARDYAAGRRLRL